MLQFRRTITSARRVLSCVAFGIFTTHLSGVAMIEITLHEGWSFKYEETGEWLEAKVPGCIHSDLLRQGIIKDPYYRTHSHDMKWVDRNDWEYQTTFEVSDELLNKPNIQIVFDCVDTYADIYLNGTRILQTDNYFLQWVADVKDLLREGKNTLRVQFFAAMDKGLERLQATDHPMNKIPTDSDIMGGLAEKKNAFFTRKPGYQFGWDWTESFVSVGLRRAVSIRAWDAIRVESVQVIQDQLEQEQAHLTARCKFESDQAVTGMLEIRNASDGEVYANEEVHLEPGMTELKVPFTIDEPRLWWTNGLGEAHLYPLVFHLEMEGQDSISHEERIGLRKVRLVREPDMLGDTFYFELNGVPVFAKGANYIPQDNFLDRVTDERYESLIRSAVDANMNMIRVWGGGIYEKKIFYDLCDENGILVWQDFMFGGGVMYPATEDYLDNVRKEVAYQVQRLRNHPSIALWCGNNEVYEALKHWGWKTHFNDEEWKRIWDDYYLLFNKTIPEVLGAYDSTRSYWPSSPLSDWDEAASWDGFSGDLHYWEIWFLDAPFEKTNTRHGRFNSEYGFQSFPDMQMIRKFSEPQDWEILSDVMQHRQKSYVGNQQIRSYMEMYYRVPSSFEHFVYLSQVLQAYGVGKSIEIHRKHMPVCMGSLYWQLNDCWPAISWSSMDYHQSWKALHYRVQDAFEPILAVPEVQDDLVNIYVVSDHVSAEEVTLELTLLDFSGNALWKDQADFTLLPTMSRSYYTVSKEKLLGEHSESSVLLWIEVKQGEKQVAQNILYFNRPKDLDLPDADLDMQLEPMDGGTRLHLSADQLLKDVYLSLKDGDGFFSDNYFDLLPGKEKTITLTHDGNMKITADRIRCITLKDAMP